MKSVYLFHDAYSGPHKEWLPWVKHELEKVGYAVFAPELPVGPVQSLASWDKIFTPFEKRIDTQSILIGHGIGALYVLNLLARREGMIEKAILVSGFAEKIPHQGFNYIAKSYLQNFDWHTLRQKSQAWYVIHGTDDPFIPFDAGKRLSQNLEARFIPVEEGGHLNQASGFTQNTQVLQAVFEVLAPKPISGTEALRPQDIAYILKNKSLPETQKNIPMAQTSGEVLPDLNEMARIQQEQARLGGGEASMMQPLPDTVTPRTLYKDLSQVMTTHSGKVVSAALEAAREEESQKKIFRARRIKNVIYGFLGTALVIATVFIVRYTMTRLNEFNQIVPVERTASLIRAEQQTLIPLVSPSEITNFLAQASRGTRSRSIHHIVFIPDEQSRNPVSLETLFDHLGIRTSLGSIATEYLYGFMGRENDVPAPFILIRFDDLETVLPLVTAEESRLTESFELLFGLTRPDGWETLGSFEDTFVANIPARVLRMRPRAPEPLPPQEEILPFPEEEFITQTSDGAQEVETEQGAEETEIPSDLSEIVTDESPALPEASGELSLPEEIIPQIPSSPAQQTLILYSFLNTTTLIITPDETLIPEIIRRDAEARFLDNQ
jgi:uncharacterized protein